MESLEPPRIPLGVVEWLQADLFRRAPSGDTCTEADARSYLGQVALVKRLKVIAEDQINPPEKDSP